MMMMKLRNFILLIFVVLCLSSVYAEDPEPEELVIGESKRVEFKVDPNFAGITEKKAGHFHFTIDEKIPDENLILLVLGRRDFTHSPSLYLSTVDEEPSYETVKGGNTYMCGILGVDVCEIESEQIKIGQKYHIGVYCIKSCVFDIKLKYEKEKRLELDEHITMMFAEEEDVKEVKINIPENVQGDHILFEALLINPGDINEPFSMFASTTEGEFDETTADFVAEDIWFNGKGFQLNRDDERWKEGQDYTILVQAQKGSLIVVQTQLYNQNRSLKLEKDLRDIVGYEEIRYFSMTIPDYINFKQSGLSLSFDLEPYMGMVEMFVKHADDDTTELEKYQWTETDIKGSVSLSISHKDIVQEHLEEAKFTVAIRGATAASFRLLAYTSDINNRQLVFDCTETGYLEEDDLTQYQLNINDLTDTDITLSLTQIVGDSDLFLKVCKQETNAANCKITHDDIAHKKDKAAEGDFYYSDKTGQGQDVLQFKYDSKSCNVMNFLLGDHCIYTVGVFGKDNDTSKFKLVARHNNSLIHLIENQPIHEYLIEENSAFFKFTVMDDQQIEKIIFHITAISGELDVYLGRDDNYPYPDYEHSDRQGYNEIESLKFTAKDDGPLKGNYYISIKAWSAAYYNVQVKVYRREKDGAISSQRQQIHYGQTLKGYLYFNQTETFWFYPDRKYENRQMTKLFFYYHEYDVNSKDEKSFSSAYPEIKVYYIYKDSGERQQLNSANYLQSFQFTYLEVPTNIKELGHYEVEIIHKQQQYQNILYDFSFSINAGDIWRIIPEFAYVSQLEDTDSESYEMYLSEPQQVYVELFECFGKVDLQAATSYEKLESGQFDNPLKIPEFKGQHKIIPFSVDSEGGFYFQVESTKMENVEDQDMTLFMVLPHVLPLKSAMPHDVFYIPQEEPYIQNELNIKYVSKETNSVQVSFKKIRCVNNCIGVDYIIDQYLYNLHITNDPQYLQFFSKCDLGVNDLQYFGIEKDKNLYHKKYTLEYGLNEDKEDIVQFTLNDLPNEKLYIEMMGIVFIRSNEAKPAQPYTFVYEQNIIDFTSITDPESNNKDHEVDNKDKDKGAPTVVEQEEENDNYNHKKQQQNLKGESALGILGYIIMMLIGGTIAAALLGFYCYKRRGMGLLPQSFAQQDDVEGDLD